jgi:hypothetical protein
VNRVVLGSEPAYQNFIVDHRIVLIAIYSTSHSVEITRTKLVTTLISTN